MNATSKKLLIGETKRQLFQDNVDCLSKMLISSKGDLQLPPVSMTSTNLPFSTQLELLSLLVPRLEYPHVLHMWLKLKEDVLFWQFIHHSFLQRIQIRHSKSVSKDPNTLTTIIIKKAIGEYYTLVHMWQKQYGAADQAFFLFSCALAFHLPLTSS